MTERALEQKMNPITGMSLLQTPGSMSDLVAGISSEGYNGKGFVVTK